jgi:hypothetical protein
MALGAEWALPEFHFCFPAVPATKIVAITIRFLELHEDFLDHQHTRPPTGVAYPEMRDVAMRVFRSRSSRRADNLIFRHIRIVEFRTELTAPWLVPLNSTKAR